MNIFGKKKDEPDPIKEEINIIKQSINSMMTMQRDFEDRMSKKLSEAQKNPQDFQAELQPYAVAINSIAYRVEELEKKSGKKGDAAEKETKNLTAEDVIQEFGKLAADLNKKVGKDGKK